MIKTLKAGRKTLIIVMSSRYIEPECQDALQELDRMGYDVWRARSLSLLDYGRSILSSQALDNTDCDSIMWIDSDIGFSVDDVARLRSHNLPMVSGVYAKKGVKDFACHFSVLGEMKVDVDFGSNGGLYHLDFASFGFTLVRREVFEAVATQLPKCISAHGVSFAPYFLPTIDGVQYLEADYAFCLRAKRAGYKIMADTTIRLKHFGVYPFTFEDVCR